MSATLVVVPSSCWVSEVDMFAGTDMLVLDDLLLSGVAGPVFKRLRLAAAIHPLVRAEYDAKRHAYLAAVLPHVLESRGEVVVIGTHPTDVDLYDYQSVAAVQMADLGMRELSKIVYGDPLMLQVEYGSVLRSIGDAVDRWFHVVSWHEITMLVMRQFPERATYDANLAVGVQRKILSDVWMGQQDAEVWMEDELPLDIHMRKGFLIADYDYLTVLRPAWRDAVVRQLGAAPVIELVFKLPWFVVEPKAMNSLCFRTNAMGTPSVSMRGRSLVEFVRSRLANTFTVRELVGTWIGSLLCDNVTAVDTAGFLGMDTLSTTAEVTFPVVKDATHVVRVPLEYAWMYAAVPDVVPTQWLGERSIEGNPVVRVVPSGWAVTLPLVGSYNGYRDSVTLGAEVVKMLYRLHTMSFTDTLLPRLYEHILNMSIDGPTAEVFDANLTMVLPGYNYLASFPAESRMMVVGQLGMDPMASSIVEMARSRFSYSGLVSVENIVADAFRGMLLAGRKWSVEMHHLRIGSELTVVQPGYCYEILFAPVHRTRIKQILGPYPMLSQVMDWRYVPWWNEGAMDSVHVVSGAKSVGKPVSGYVMHFTMRVEGMTLREFVDTVNCINVDSYGVPLAVVRIGDSGTCYGVQMFVATIIGWTIVGVLVVGFLARMLYMRCGGGTQTSGGMYGRRY